MATLVELRHLCLLMSAGSMVYPKRGAMLSSSVRCTLYLLLGFALRRLGRDLLRGTTTHSHIYPSTHELSRQPSPLLRTLPGHFPVRTNPLKDKQASPRICCI